MGADVFYRTVLVRTNGSISLVGRAGYVRKRHSPKRNLYFASYLLRMRCIETSVLPRWIYSITASNYGRAWIERRAASSAGQHNISLSTLLTMPIPLPCVAEQHNALQVLEKVLEFVCGQEQSIDTSLRQSAAQRKNILKAAFSGQLVPQDSNDEPASDLLGRIRAARSVEGAKATRKRARKTKENE